ncbi:MAG TPA: hypothetical protein VFZ61_34740 [Polyangiales bacterium]
MSTLRKLLVVSSLSLALGACSGDGDKISHDASNEPAEDAAVEPGAEADAGAEDAAAGPVGPVPLTLWVHDLIENRTSDEAEPDTVDDKLITDDTNEASFDKYLP